MQTVDYAAVPGVAECRLDEATLTQLPANEAPAPWDCRLSAVVWWTRPSRAARRAAGAAATAGATPIAVVGGIVSYEDTPVGPYHEAYGAVLVRRGWHAVTTIPFMSVDSLRSLVGGRGNWSLPKCPGEFDGEPGGGAVAARGDGWRVSATARPFGPGFPVRTTATIVQPWPDGVVRESTLHGRTRARSALVTVEVESDGELPSWLRPGRHLGAVLSETRFTFSEAR